MYLTLRQILLIFVCAMFSAQILADAKEERRITISASIFPRLIAVDEHILDKLDGSGNVRLGILFSSDEEKAKVIAKQMIRKVKTIAGKLIVFNYINVDQVNLFNIQDLSGLFVVQPMSDSQIEKIVAYSTKHSILSFSPFEGDVERGVIASIFVSAKIRPYFNVKSLDKARVKIKPALLKVSKTYE